jgi:hypothetical protein
MSEASTYVRPGTGAARFAARGGQDFVVENQVDSRPRRHYGEPLEQLQWIKTQVRRPARPAAPEREQIVPSAPTCSRSAPVAARDA